jgi:hypothetical protein
MPEISWWPAGLRAQETAEATQRLGQQDESTVLTLAFAPAAVLRA